MSVLPQRGTVAIRWGLGLACTLIVGCGGEYQPKDSAYFQTRRVDGISVVLKAGPNSCFMDLYFPDGSKYYVGGVDHRICLTLQSPPTR